MEMMATDHATSWVMINTAQRKLYGKTLFYCLRGYRDISQHVK